MRIAVLLTWLVMWLQSCPAVEADERSLGARLEQLAPRAAGLAQVEVLEIKEVDLQSGDGPLYLDVSLRILRRSGETTDNIHIVKAQGGLQPEGSPEFKPTGPVKLDTFEKGHRYWVAFSSQYDWERCPQGIVASWPEKDGPKSLEEAIRTDHYAHRPQYDPKSGLTHGWWAEQDKKSWRARLERDGRRLWEVSLPGEKVEREGLRRGEWKLLQRNQWPSGLAHADENASGWFLLAETLSSLDAANRYQLPAGKRRLTYALDADSGKTAAIWISRLDLTPTATPSILQYFDLKNGAIRREERYDVLQSGGLAAGAKEERWLRKSVRTYDLDTEHPSTDEVFRWTESPEGSKFVPVDKQ